MSFLAPLYALAAFAIGLPILFHLIQRRPQGKLNFSSLMFLTPSPPRITRRSRISNWLLLLLRAAALLLLACAFARPFIRTAIERNVALPARRMLLLVDTSASMRQQGVWARTQEVVEQVLADLQPGDEIALTTFDRSTHNLVAFNDGAPRTLAQRAELIRKAWKNTHPTWYATDLGSALMAGADLLRDRESTVDEPLPQQILLVSDLQASGNVERVRDFAWPADLTVEVRDVSAPTAENARATLLFGDTVNPSGDAADETAASEDASVTTDLQTVRVRVENGPDARDEELRLGWVNSQGRLLDEKEFIVHVPPGASRVVRVTQPPGEAVALQLAGDTEQFDNLTYIAHSSRQQKLVLFIGTSTEDPRSSLFYYLERAPFDSPRVTYQVQSQSPEQPLLEIDPVKTPFVVYSDAPPMTHASGLQQYVRAGGSLLIVLPQSPAPDQQAANTHSLDGLRTLSGDASLTSHEAKVADYRMLSEIDFSHPLFKPFADPRYGDFTRVHFWRHRVLDYDANTWAAAAYFDDRSPAILHQRVEQGHLWLLAAGWQPDESQLALSTKFVPLLSGMLDPSHGANELRSEAETGSSIDVREAGDKAQVQFPD
ncbi:MAG: BatA domain-containing protein, partial [Planctomycetales bacterium]|nr:BatA domain-containing protein [Planctomycetales bacterium]